MRRVCLANLALAVSCALAAAAEPATSSVSRFDALKPRLWSKDKAERQSAYEAYLREGEEGRKQLREELLAIRTDALAACRDFSLAADTQKRLLAAHTKLQDARKEALRVIFDKNIYPDADHGRVGQPTVDKAVDAVKAAYPYHRHLFDPVARRFGRVQRAYERIKEIDALLPRCDAKDVAPTPPIEKAVGPDLQADLVKALLELASFNDYCTRCTQYNEQVRTSLSWGERKVVDLTNEYRMQLGIKPMAINEPLVQAARKHSEEMARLGYFAHDSPTPANRSPGQRCQNEGYKNFAGENCAGGGTPEGAYHGWYNSSGHHRNMINPRNNEIGVGVGGPWTEDFGARPGLDLDHPPRSWRAAAPPKEAKKK